MPSLSLTITIGEANAGLTVDEQALTWEGATDPEPDAPILRWRVQRNEGSAPFEAAVETGDADALAQFVARLPMPGGLLDALAERCFQRRPERALAIACGRAFCDLRWQRALAAYAIASGAAEAELPAPTPPVIAATLEWGVVHLLPLPDGALVILSARREEGTPHEARLDLWRDGATTELQRIPLPPKAEVALPTPLAVEPGRFAVSLYEPSLSSAQLWIFDGAGMLARSGRTAIESLPQAFSESGKLGWLHAERHHVGFPLADTSGAIALALADPPAPARSEPRAEEGTLQPIYVVDGWLAVFRNPTERGGQAWCDEIRWLALDGANDDFALPWFQDVRALEAGADALWLLNARGVWALHPTRPTRFRWATGPAGLVVEGDRIWFGFYNQARREEGVVSVDLVTSGEEWRVPLDARPERLVRVPGGVIAGGREWCWIRDDGAIVERRPAGYNLSEVQLGATTVVAAGEDLLFIDGAGALVRRVVVPGRVQLLGRVGELAVCENAGYGPPWFDGLLLFDAHGRLCARIPQRGDGYSLGALRRLYHGDGNWSDPGAITPQALWTREFPHLWRWTAPPVAAPTRPSLLAIERRPTVRAQTCKRDPGAAGLEITHQRHLGLGNEYFGDDDEAVPGVSASDGAVVTLRGCVIHDGVEAGRGATVFLLDCACDDVQVLDESSFVVAIAGTTAAPASSHP